MMLWSITGGCDWWVWSVGSVGVVYYRVEHEAFTNKDMEAYQQFVRVMFHDFLPFVKRTVSTLYSEVLVEQVALSTPYPLRKCHAHTTVSTSTIGTRGKTSLDLNMELNLEEISQPLRGVAPEVFKEIELAASRLQVPELEAELSGAGSVALEAEPEVEPNGTRGVALEEEPNGTRGVALEEEPSVTGDNEEVEDIPSSH